MPSSVTAIGMCAVLGQLERFRCSAPDNITPWPARISGALGGVDQRDRIAVVAVTGQRVVAAPRSGAAAAASQSNFAGSTAARPW